MRLLIDTHVLIWTVGAPNRIPQRVREALIDADNSVFASAATAWEIALKRRLGKLEFDKEFLARFDNRIEEMGFEPMSVSAAHMVRGAEIDSEHKDPFDRMLAGQALVEEMTVVTVDRAFRDLGVPVFW